MNDKIKTHWEKYKQTYITVGVGVVVGVTIFIVARKTAPTLNIGKSAVVTDVKQFVIKGDLNYTITSNRQGSPSWVVRCIETGDVFSSQNEAAKTLGINTSILSKQLNGLTESINGLHFERICMAA